MPSPHWRELAKPIDPTPFILEGLAELRSELEQSADPNKVSLRLTRRFFVLHSRWCDWRDGRASPSLTDADLCEVLEMFEPLSVGNLVSLVDRLQKSAQDRSSG